MLDKIIRMCKTLSDILDRRKRSFEIISFWGEQGQVDTVANGKKARKERNEIQAFLFLSHPAQFNPFNQYESLRSVSIAVND